MTIGGTATAAWIPQRHAVGFAHALVHRAAARLGVRVLSIKGPVAVAQGVRPDRESADADVLVEPNSYSELLEALTGLGWHPRPSIGIPDAFGSLREHSETLIHDDWPNDIDFHRFFPGFLQPDASVFDTLWAHRTVVTLASQPVFSPDRVDSIIIELLHAARAPELSRSQRDSAYVGGVLVKGFDDGERAQLVERAASTGALEPLRPYFESWGLEMPAPSNGTELDNQHLRAWQLRSQTSKNVTLGILAIRRTPLRRIPGMLRRFAFPADAVLRSHHPNLPSGRLGYVVGVVFRLWRNLPTAASSLRALRQMNKDEPSHER